jgi:ABC-type Fe3+-hydroxamate transport system substrate-binding protein
MYDDLGTDVAVPTQVRRVVSLVPSLTESVAVSAPHLLVGATDWCTHPADLDVTRVGGTKSPDVAAVRALAPDLVLANEEENRSVDLDALRAAGIAVWVTAPRTLADALTSLERMLAACRLDCPEWIGQAALAWGTAEPAHVVRTAVVPIWRRPWMVLGSDTFAGDLLRRLDLRNLYAADPQRYPRKDLAELRAAGADVVVLPDEPYEFSPTDGPEAFPGSAVALVSGRHLTWYGPSLVEAHEVLTAQLAGARSYRPPGQR